MAKPRTTKQKAALRKAQLASARKRRKGGKRKGKVRTHLRKHGAIYLGLGVAGAAIGLDHALKKRRIAKYKKIATTRYQPKIKFRTKKKGKPLTHATIYGAYAKQKR